MVAEPLDHFRASVAVRVAQRDDAVPHGSAAAAANSAVANVDVAVGRDVDMADAAEPVSDHQRAEAIRQHQPAIARIARRGTGAGGLSSARRRRVARKEEECDGGGRCAASAGG